MAEKKIVRTIGLMKLEELPEQYESPLISESTIAVMVTYRRVVGRAKDSTGKVTPTYGGAMAHYPKETGFKLDRSSLLLNRG